MASLALYAFSTHFYPRWAKPHIPCILLHHIGEPTRASDLWSIPQKRFLAILDKLNKGKCRTLSLAEVRRSVKEGVPPENPPYVFLTFDDGCRSHLELVVPELKKQNMVATFFVTLPKEASRETLGRDEIRQLSKMTEVQSHTRTFQTLPRKSKESEADYIKRLDNSLVSFRIDLAELTGKDVFALAYPSGEYDHDVMVRAQKAGYELCFTTEYGTIGPNEPSLELPRFMVTKETSLQEIEQFVNDDKHIHALAALSCLLLAVSCFVVMLTTLRS